jgi:capsule polysaccharide export protein KpsC/LpsZ
LDQVRKLIEARQHATLWENFARRWQGAPSEGGEKVRQTLGLDRRPVVLLATNVIGDSLTLGRQVFSDSMTEWLEKTVRYFAGRPDVQFVVRIHPGELITKGPSVADVVRRVLPELPEHIHLVPADARINTYDIVEIADLGLVYTTTVGMEMAMSGVPAIVGGKTHYRGKGFTIDPDSWEEYFKIVDRVLKDAGSFRLGKEQVEQSWNYAYRFFFEYPSPFPWHLLDLWKELETWPVKRLLSSEGQDQFGATFNYLVGEPRLWSQPAQESMEAA